MGFVNQCRIDELAVNKVVEDSPVAQVFTGPVFLG